MPLHHRLLFVGRCGDDPLSAALERYLVRLRRLVPTTLLRIRPADPTREGHQIVGALRPGERLVVCDPGGEPWGSAPLAALIGQWRPAGGGVAWAVGGAEGLAASVRLRAERAWSLGPLTLPHRLAQVVVAEQLYRAETMLAGGRYHRA